MGSGKWETDKVLEGNLYCIYSKVPYLGNVGTYLPRSSGLA